MSWEQKGRQVTIKHVKTKAKRRTARENASLRAGEDPMRRHCGCQGTEHGVFTNCLECGRAACEIEGQGPCYFCDSYVRRDGTDSNPEFIQLMNQDALKPKRGSRRQRVVEDSGVVNVRMSVYDDQADYYDMNVNYWLQSEEELNKAEQWKQEQKGTESREYTLTLDLEGPGAVAVAVEEAEVQAGPDWSAVSTAQPTAVKVQPTKQPTRCGAANASDSVFLNHTLTGEAEKVYHLLRDSLDQCGCQPIKRARPQSFKKDVCLSLYQPWASLVVCGFKRLEGRFWSTPHRGRLWIHAGGHETSSEETEAVLQSYRTIYPHRAAELPTLFPRRALLGCVDMVDCLPQADLKSFRTKVGLKEESDCDFVFALDSPRRLIAPLTMPGHAKLWSLKSLQCRQLEGQLVPVKPCGPSFSRHGTEKRTVKHKL